MANMDCADAPVLYTRPGCHLCDQVYAMFQGMNVVCTAVDIEKEPALEQKYGLKIPVVYLPDTGGELFFPFNDDQLKRFLQGKA